MSKSDSSLGGDLMAAKIRFLGLAIEILQRDSAEGLNHQSVNMAVHLDYEAGSIHHYGKIQRELAEEQRRGELFSIPPSSGGKAARRKRRTRRDQGADA